MTIFLRLTKLVLLDSKKLILKDGSFKCFFYDRIDLGEGNDVIQTTTVSAVKNA